MENQRPDQKARDAAWKAFQQWAGERSTYAQVDSTLTVYADVLRKTRPPMWKRIVNWMNEPY